MAYSNVTSIQIGMPWFHSVGPPTSYNIKSTAPRSSWNSRGLAIKAAKMSWIASRIASSSLAIHPQTMAARVLSLALLGLALFSAAQSQTITMTFGDISGNVYPFVLSLTAGSCLTETDALWSEWSNAIGGIFYSYNTSDPAAVVARYSNPACSTAYVWNYAIGSVPQFESEFTFASIMYLGDTAPAQPATTLQLYSAPASSSVPVATLSSSQTISVSSNVIATTSGVMSVPANSGIPSGVESEVPSGTLSIPLVSATGKTSSNAASLTGKPSFDVILALASVLGIMAFM